MNRKLTDIPVVAAVLLASAVFGGDDREADYLQFSIDRHVSVETGADFTFSAVTAVAAAENWTFGHLEGQPAVGRPVRAVWTLVFDIPVAWWFGVFLHEAYGHGGRAREVGATAGFHMGSPWERRTSYATFNPEGLGYDDLLHVFSGGSEANSFAATQLEREMVGGRAMRPLEALYVTANRMVTSAYVLRTTPDPAENPAGFWREWNGGGDVAHYLGYYHARFTGDPAITPEGAAPEIRKHYERMERHAIWNALDPGAWLSFFTAWRSVIRGESMSQIPMLRVGGRKFLPVFSSEWLLRGSTASLELVFGERVHGDTTGGPRWFSFVVRQGTGYDGGIGAVGAATESFARAGRFRLGGEIEIWDRPGGAVGGGFQVRTSLARGKLRGLFVGLGAKTAGHWPGRPLQAGPIVRLGFRVAL